MEKWSQDIDSTLVLKKTEELRRHPDLSSWSNHSYAVYQLGEHGCGTALLSDTSLQKGGCWWEKSNTQTTGISIILIVSTPVVERRDESKCGVWSSMFLHHVCVPGEAGKQGGKLTHKLTDECMDLIFSSSWLSLISFSVVNFWFCAAVSQNLSLHDTWVSYYMAPRHCVRLQDFQEK